MVKIFYQYQDHWASQLNSVQDNNHLSENQSPIDSTLDLVLILQKNCDYFLIQELKYYVHKLQSRTANIYQYC